MNLSVSKYWFFILAFALTIGIHGQEKVTKEKENTNTPFITDQNHAIENTSKMPIYNPNYDLDKQINLALIDDTKEEKILMPIYDPFSSLLINPQRQLSLGEIAKKLSGNK